MMARWYGSLLPLALALLLPSQVLAQVQPDTVTRTVVADTTGLVADTTARRPLASVAGAPAPDTTVLRRFPSPGGAFLRSVLVPGWGQAAYGAHFRGGIYFGLEAGSWFMLLKTMAKLGEARDIESWRVGAARESIIAEIIADPELSARYHEAPATFEEAINIAIDEDPAVVDIRDLVSARKEQREDWIVLTLFWMLASGVDAFVNAHLSDFPARINAESRPDGAVDFGVRLPVGGGR